MNHRTILEIGCGLDPFFNSFNDFDTIIIVEPSAVFFENAKTNANNDENFRKRVIVINAFLEEAANELSKHEFDFVIISCLLHEIENVSLFLEVIHKIINPNTVVHIDVPNAHSFHRVLAYEMGMIESVFEMSPSNKRFQQQRVFDIESLSDLIIRHGFKIIRSGTNFLKPFSHKQMYELLENNIIDKTVLDGLYKMTKYMPEMGSEIFLNFMLK